MRTTTLVSAALAVVTTFAVWGCATEATPASGDSTDAARSRAAFVEVARVLRHPRCMNCHPTGGFPRIGDDRRPHAMHVLRGPHDHGMPAMHCSTCHRPENQDFAGVPGAPNWHLAPLAMGWEGLDDHMLAEALKDPAKNGNRSLQDMLHHMAHDPLVGWGWEPGAGRAAPPVSREAVVASFKTWIDNGAVSPLPGTTSKF